MAAVSLTNLLLPSDFPDTDFPDTAALEAVVRGTLQDMPGGPFEVTLRRGTLPGEISIELRRTPGAIGLASIHSSDSSEEIARRLKLLTLETPEGCPPT